MTRRAPRRRARGISLVEALVALIVMSFGTLAVLGMQATLRANGDLAKQRSEAVRIAQESLEGWRAYADVDGDDDDIAYYTEVLDEERTVDGVNASYEVAFSVPEEIESPRIKTVRVTVTWQDRAGQTQSVEMSSSIAGTPPALVGSLAIPVTGSAIQNPGGRSPLIPKDAISQTDGTSLFRPPGAADSVRWVFDNKTGYITKLCPTCTAYSARLLAGFIRFSTDAAQTPNAIVPGSPTLPDVQLYVNQTFPIEFATGGTEQDVTCYIDRSNSGYLAYYCAVPVGAFDRWSGASWVGITSGQATALASPVAQTATDAATNLYRICRYTFDTVRSNDQHPATYTDVTGALVNQNFLVILAGNGTTRFSCPDGQDDWTTAAHQPVN